MALGLALSFYLGFTLYHLTRLHRWLLSKKQGELPEAGGLWGEVFNEIHQLEKNLMEIPGAVVNGHGQLRLPGVLNLSIVGEKLGRGSAGHITPNAGFHRSRFFAGSGFGFRRTGPRPSIAPWNVLPR